MPRRAPLKTLAMALAAGMLLLPTGAHADLEAGRRAFLAGEYPTALREFRAAGDAGNVQALFLAGQMLVMGQGVPKDMPAGLALLERAAATGHVQAAVTAGTAYAYADGVPADYARAFRLLEPAAQAGDPHAQNNVAVLYHFGLGTAADQVKAMAWALRAERQGLLQAINLRQEIEATLTLAQKSEAMKLAAAQAGTPGAPVQPAPQLAEVPAAAPAPTPSRQPEPAPVPPARPAVATSPAEPRTAPPVAAPAPVQTPPATAPATPTQMASAVATAGEWAVQLAALPDRAEAERQWRAIAQRQSALLQGLEPTFAAADLGAKGVFIRVLVGDYASRAEADAFCTRLKQSGQDCLPRRR